MFHQGRPGLVINMCYVRLGRCLGAIIFAILINGTVAARDDGRYANSPLKGMV